MRTPQVNGPTGPSIFESSAFDTEIAGTAEWRATQECVDSFVRYLRCLLDAHAEQETLSASASKRAKPSRTSFRSTEHPTAVAALVSDYLASTTLQLMINTAPTAKVQSHVMSGLQAALLLMSDTKQHDVLADADLIGEVANIGLTLMDKLVNSCGWLDADKGQAADPSRNSAEETYHDALLMVSRILAQSHTRTHTWILRDPTAKASELKHELSVVEKILRRCTVRAGGAANVLPGSQSDEKDALLIINAWMRGEPGRAALVLRNPILRKLLLDLTVHA